MRKILIDALRAHYQGEIAKHKANVEVFLENSSGVGEHPDVVETISLEVTKIAEAEDNLNVLEKHFNQTLPRI